MNKDGLRVLAANDIWFPWQFFGMQTEAASEPMNQGANHALRFHIFRSNTPHVF